jgi:hypothetical protein
MHAMDKRVRCDSGYEVRAVGEEQVAAEVRAHARDAHGIEFTHADALLVVLRSELHEQGLGRIAPEKSASSDDSTGGQR